MSSSSSSWSRAPLWFIRSVVDSHTTHGVHHPWTSLAALVSVMTFVLVLSVWQRAGQISRGTTVGAFDAASAPQPPSALGFTSLQFNRSGVEADGSLWQMAASGAVPLQHKSQCADLQAIFFVPLNNGSAVFHRLTPLSYEYYEPTCTHLWQFTSSGLRPADLLSRTALTGAFTLGLLRTTPGLACPSFRTPSDRRANLQVFASWPFNVCTVSNSGLSNTSAIVLLPSIDHAQVGPTEVWDDHCWAGDSIGAVLDSIVAADFLASCEQSFEALTFLNSFEHRTSLYDAVALTASVMTLVYAAIKALLRCINTAEEKRKGVLVEPAHKDHLCATCGAAAVAASDDNLGHSPSAPLKPMPSASSRASLGARLLDSESL